MERRQLVYLFGIALLSIAALVGTFVAGNEPLLGLDLQGGVSVRYRTTEPDVDPDQIDQAVEIIRNRVDGLGVAEPEIQAQGDGILVSLPGVDDQQRALELVGETAVMRFRPVLQDLAPGSTNRPASYPEDLPLGPDGFTPSDSIEEDSIIVVPANAELAQPGRYVLGPTGMTGEGLDDAQGVFDGIRWIVSVDLKGGDIGEDAFLDLTQQCFAGTSSCPRSASGPGRIAVDLDNEVISAPAVQNADLGQGARPETAIRGPADRIGAGEPTDRFRDHRQGRTRCRHH